MRELRVTHFVYCVMRVEGNRYVLLNRRYKPIGYNGDDYVDYDEYAVKLKGLTQKKANTIENRGYANLDAIYLYDDGCVPTNSKANMDSYLKRLAILMELTAN